MATLRYRAYKYGVFYQLNFDVAGPLETYISKFEYTSTHTLAAQAVKPHSIVFDIGCSSGYLADKLTHEKSCEVYGIDHKPSKGKSFVEFFPLDIEQAPFPETVHQADYILLLDVIEHLRSPETFLLKLREAMQLHPVTLIITTPNVAFIVIRLMLLLGQFNYGKMGILDITHTRLFTFATIQRLLTQTGFTVKTVKGVPVPFPRVIRSTLLARCLLALQQLAIGIYKKLFAYQIYIEASANPTLSAVIATTIDYSTQKQRQYQREQQQKNG